MAAIGKSERALVDALDEPALVLEGGIVRLANPPARDLFGSGVEGRDVRLAIRHPQALQHILGGRSGEVDVAGIVDPGRSWRLIVRALDRDLVLLRLIDRSDSVSAEKMRVDFVANASHELRTPLSTVIGYAETLAEEADISPEARSGFGRTIRDEARRMQRIIEDLMSLSRIEADRFVAPAESVSIGDVIQSAVAGASQGRAAPNCEFDIDVEPDLPAVRGDHSQLIQVLENLISNAVRYGCDKSSSKIEISARRDGGWIVTTVTDHGPGIPREHLPRVTERFYRVDAARSRETGGTGLGLAIVKHIIERHRGLLDIRSTIGVGTSIDVRLPVTSG